VKPLTFATYENIARRRLVRRIGGLRLQAVTGGHLNAAYRDMEAEGLSVSTRRTTHSVAHRALRDAVRWGHLVRNPAARADPPSAEDTRVMAWTAGELARFLDHVSGDRLFALWRLGATTGMRRGELAGLTWQALDIEGRQLRVERQLVATRGGASFGSPKSKRSLRTITLDDETCDVLRVHRDTQLLERDFAGAAYVDHDLVFANQLGQPIHPKTLTAAFANHRRAAGIPVGTLHVLRHTAATLMLTAGVPVHIAAARLGDHPTVLLGTYAHLLPRSDEQAAQVVAGALAAR
jgi:integrase